MIFVSIVSIFGITGAVWAANRVLPFFVCPICAGVAGTWLWMFTVLLLGYSVDLYIVAMLMGGSVVGIAYQLEKKLPAGKYALLWKTLFIPAGFVVVYSLITFEWTLLVGVLSVVGVLLLVFLKNPGMKQPTGKVEGRVLSEVEGRVLSEVEGRVLSEVEGRVLSEVEGLKEKMENCC